MLNGIENKAELYKNERPRCSREQRGLFFYTIILI